MVNHASPAADAYPDDPRRSGASAIFYKLLNGISAATVVVTGISLVVLTFIFSWLVYGRYVLNATPTWVEQIALLLVAYITFLGAAVGIHENTHLGVSYFRELSPPLLRKIFTVISHLVMLIFGGVMAVAGVRLTLFKWDNLIPLIDLPEGVRAIPIALCGTFIVLFSIGHLILLAKGIEERTDFSE